MSAPAVVPALLDLLFPTRCAGCDRPGALLCEACRSRLPLIAAERACPRCGAPEGARWCGECAGQVPRFEAVRCAGVLEPPLSRMVALHKDAGEQRLAVPLAALATEAAGTWRDWPDAVVAVPASRAAVARRGFDHGSAIGVRIAESLGVPAIDALLAGSGRDQRALGRSARLENAVGRIRVVRGIALPRRVLLVDDVLTTGATLEAATSALLEAGAERVRALTVARTCG